MTTLKRTLIEPRDIVGIEYECAHCQSRYTVLVTKFDRHVTSCPNCREKWMLADNAAPSNEETLYYFIEQLKQIQTRKLGVTIRLELADLDADDAPPPAPAK